MKEMTKNNKITVVLIIYLMITILLKALISTYLKSFITIIPSVVIIIWFLYKFLKGEINIKKQDVFFALLLLIGTTSGIIHNQRLIAIIYQIKSLSVYYLLYMIIRDNHFDKEQIKSILKGINIITIILVLLSIIEILFQKNYLFPVQWSKEIIYADNYIRAYSMICNPNVYAFYLLFIILFNYRFGNKEFEFRDKLLYSLYSIGVFISISRSALMCYIGIVGLYFLYYIFKKENVKSNHLDDKRYVLQVCFILVISILSTISIYKYNEIYKDYIYSGGNGHIIDKDDNNKNTDEDFNSRMSAMWSSGFVSNSLGNGRVAIIKYGLSELKGNYLIGKGFSSFLTASNFLNPDKKAEKLGLAYADNQYIAILVETGIFGIVSMLVTFFMILYDQYKEQKYISVLATLIMLFFGLFINVLEVQLITYVYFLFIGLDRKI